LSEMYLVGALEGF